MTSINMKQTNAPDELTQWLQTAIAHHQADRLPQAQALYLQILQRAPQQADALHLLGLIEHQQGRSAQAVAHIRQAIALRPLDSMFCFNLANMLFDLGQLDDAASLYSQAARLAPGSIDPLLGLGAVARAQNRQDECARVYRQVIQLAPGLADAHRHLGQALLMQGQYREAERSFRQCLALHAGDVQARVGLAGTLSLLDRLDEAAACFEAVRARQPDHPGVYLGLANVRKAQDRLDEAAEAGRRALALQPDHDAAYINLANTLLLLGQLDEALDVLRRGLALDSPRAAEIFSNKLFIGQLQAERSAAEVFAEHQAFAARFESPLKAQWPVHTNTRDPHRRLRLGYVSGDLREHVVAYFIEPILAHHDKGAFEIFAYYSYISHDDATRRIARHVDHWCDAYGLTDEVLAQRIRDDGIDILVDLSGHTVYNRLLTFARKPAPVQATWVGYPGSTGLTAIDYRISDPWQDPPGLTERYHSEALVRLPSGMAFAPDPAAPPINDLPALTSGSFVLACMNNLSKVNPAVVALWSRILSALPLAQLMLGNVTDDSVRGRLLTQFAQNGIGPDRLLLQPRVPLADYLALHQKIDLALDPFPYNGGTTTMHSLWMGVPVVTLAGDHAVSRLSAAHLLRVGLSQFVTHTPDAYLQCVINAAQDLQTLNAIRQSLRTRMSAIDCSPHTITRDLEAAYRQMWRAWCANVKPC